MYCVASDIGGGVFASGTFKMSGPAVIRSCTAESATQFVCGGGVYVNVSSSFEMSDTAIIEGCQAISTSSNSSNGGGVYASSGKFNMNDGKISGNTGDGVFVHNDATFTVSRTPTVTGNTNTTNSAASNVYLMGSAYITIGNQGLNGSDGSIGVTKLPNSSPAEIVIANGVNEDYSGKFSSDDETREVKYENKQLVLKKKATQPSEHTHSYNENTWGKNATHHWH